LQKEGYFDGNPLFFFGHLTQVVVLEIVAAYLAFTYGLNSLPMFFLTALLLGTAQAQAGWLQVGDPKFANVILNILPTHIIVKFSTILVT
jgi:hypothetical protein